MRPLIQFCGRCRTAHAPEGPCPKKPKLDDEDDGGIKPRPKKPAPKGGGGNPAVLPVRSDSRHIEPLPAEHKAKPAVKTKAKEPEPALRAEPSPKKSPAKILAEMRAKKAARQKRWRDKLKKQKEVASG